MIVSFSPSFIVLVLLVSPLSRAALAAPLVARVEAVAMTVADVDRTAAFFAHVLTFEKISDVEIAGDAYANLEGVAGLRMRVVRMRLGDESIRLTQYLIPRGRPAPSDARSNDRWFQHIAIIVSDMDRAYAWLQRHDVEHVSPRPQRLPAWNKSAGGIRAFYFKDPDGDVLEILEFPPDKGDPKWQRPTDKLFLGIDHTAIVVADTDASVRFYRDHLGFAVSGVSVNSGIEQEHLNNVDGAHLRITGLRAPAGGPGIELLEYLAPRDGRAYPDDERANDLMHWQTELATGSAEAAGRALAGKTTTISAGVVTLPDSALGFRHGYTIRDPDGHAMQLVER